MKKSVLRKASWQINSKVNSQASKLKSSAGIRKASISNKLLVKSTLPDAMLESKAQFSNSSEES